MALMRTCIGCTQTDDHPKDIVDHGTFMVVWHLDCHVITVDCRSCKNRLADAKGAKGETLRAHLVSLPPLVLDEHGEEVS